MRIATYIKATLSLAALAFLAYYVDPAAMARAAAGADPRLIVAAVILLPINVALEGLVWHLLISRLSRATKLRDHIGALFAGYALGFFTPARAGEFAGRAFYIRHDDRWEIAILVGAQRLFDMGVVHSVGCLATVFYIMAVDPQPVLLWRVLAAAGGVSGAALVAASASPATIHRILARERAFSFLRSRIDFLERLSSLDGLGMLGLSFLRYGVYSTQFLLLLMAIVPNADVSLALLGIALVFFVKLLLPPVTLMDVGIREGAAVFFLGSLGFPEAAALNASLLLFTINLLVPAAAGLPLVMRLRLSNT